MSGAEDDLRERGRFAGKLVSAQAGSLCHQGLVGGLRPHLRKYNFAWKLGILKRFKVQGSKVKVESQPANPNTVELRGRGCLTTSPKRRKMWNSRLRLFFFKGFWWAYMVSSA
jgi:hypothetical protein